MSCQYSANFLECAKMAQRTIFLLCSVALAFYVLAVAEKLEKIKIPVADIELKTTEGITVLFILFIALSFYFLTQLKSLKDNFDSIDSDVVKDSLKKAPYIVCGSRYLQVSFKLLPIVLLYFAFYRGFQGSIPLALLVTGVCSVFMIQTLFLRYD